MFLSKADLEDIMGIIGATEIFYDDGELPVLGTGSGLKYNKENSLISTDTIVNGSGSLLNNVWQVSVYGYDLERDAEGNLVYAGGTRLLKVTAADNNEDLTVDRVLIGSDFGTKFTFKDDDSETYSKVNEWSAFGEGFNADIKNIERNYEMEFDIYSVIYDYYLEDGSQRWTAHLFKTDGQQNDSILNFVTKEETPEVPSEPETPSEPDVPDTPEVNEPYEVVLPTESTSVSATDFSAILTENATKDVVIKSNNNVTFTFAKGTMSAVEGMENYDFGTSIVSDFASAGTMNANVTADNFVTRINYNYSGKLPAPASIKIFVGTEYAGKTLYYSKLVESGFTYITSAVVDKDGYIIVIQDSCSDYVLTTEKLGEEVSPSVGNDNTQAPTTNTETPIAPKTGENSLVAVFVIMLICGFGYMYVGLKNKKLV